MILCVCFPAPNRGTVYSTHTTCFVLAKAERTKRTGIPEEKGVKLEQYIFVNESFGENANRGKCGSTMELGGIWVYVVRAGQRIGRWWRHEKSCRPPTDKLANSNNPRADFFSHRQNAKVEDSGW